MTETNRGEADETGSAQPSDRDFWCIVALVAMLLAPVSAFIAFLFGRGLSADPSASAFTGVAGWLVFVFISSGIGARLRRRGGTGWPAVGYGVGAYGAVNLVLLYLAAAGLG